MSTPEIVLHGTESSGHAHRVELLLRMLGLPHRYVVARAGSHISFRTVTLCRFVTKASAQMNTTHPRHVAWLRRVEGLPNFKPIPSSPLPAQS